MGTQGKGSVSATKAVETQGKEGSVSATKWTHKAKAAVETQGKEDSGSPGFALVAERVLAADQHVEDHLMIVSTVRDDSGHFVPRGAH